MAAVCDLRKKFDKSLEIDKARRASLISLIERMQVGGEGAGAVPLRTAAVTPHRPGGGVTIKPYTKRHSAFATPERGKLVSLVCLSYLL